MAIRNATNFQFAFFNLHFAIASFRKEIQVNPLCGGGTIVKSLPRDGHHRSRPGGAVILHYCAAPP
jgi:hypothetical protein